MKQFLRFQISGLTCIFWTLLFFLPYIDWSKLSAVKAEKIIIALVGSVALALPLGTIIHQVSISLLSPFRKIRFLNRRRVLDDLSGLNNSLSSINTDPENKNLLVFSQGMKISWSQSNDIRKELDVEYIRQEISNRYSYYYVRIDNGLMAPICGFGLFLLLSNCLHKAGATALLDTPLLCNFTMPIIAVIFCVLMVMYVPELLTEVDHLERLLLKFENSINTAPAAPAKGDETPAEAEETTR
jgi:hypothetical protein